MVGFVALFGCFANARHVWTRRRAIAFAVLALPWSKLWLRIGYDRPGVFWQFANQRYFMNTGPYASDTMYVVHGVAAVVSAAVIFIFLRRRADPTIASSGTSK